MHMLADPDWDPRVQVSDVVVEGDKTTFNVKFGNVKSKRCSPCPSRFFDAKSR